MTTSTSISIAAGLLIISFALYRQLRTRPLKPNYRMPMIMIALGIGLVLLNVHAGAPVTPAEVTIFVVGLLLAVGLGWPRARSMTVFRRDGRWMTRGTWLTAALWIVLIGTRITASTLIPVLFGETAHAPTGLDQSTMPIFLGVSLAAQAYLRARRVPVTDSAASTDVVGALS